MLIGTAAKVDLQAFFAAVSFARSNEPQTGGPSGFQPPLAGRFYFGRHTARGGSA